MKIHKKITLSVVEISEIVRENLTKRKILKPESSVLGVPIVTSGSKEIEFTFIESNDQVSGNVSEKS